MRFAATDAWATGRAVGYGQGMTTFDFQAYVTQALFDRDGRAVFALGDGSVRFEAGEVVQAHDGAALAAVAHPSGDGVVTGGDDGRLVWSRAAGPETLAELKGKWIDALAASSASTSRAPRSTASA